MPIYPTPPIRPRISGEGGSGLFGQETPGGIGTLNPGALGWPSFKDFMPTRNVDYVGPRLSSQQIADAYAASIPQSKPVLSGISGRPLGKTLGNLVSNPSFFPGMALSMTPLGMLAAPTLDWVSGLYERTMLNNYAMEQMQQGRYPYSSGTIGGNPFTISPGLFGIGQVMTGNVPHGFDIGTAENMQKVAAGIDPNTGLSLVNSTGQGGYNQAGDWVDEYGNVMGGTMESAQGLADKHGITLGEALTALEAAREGGKTLGEALAPEHMTEQQHFTEEDEAGMDYGKDFNTGGPVIKPVDPKQAHIQQLNDELAEDIIAASKRSPLVMLGLAGPVGIEQLTTMSKPLQNVLAEFSRIGFTKEQLKERGHDPASPVDTNKPTVMFPVDTMVRKGLAEARYIIGHEYAHAGMSTLANPKGEGRKWLYTKLTEEAIARHHDMVTGNPKTRAATEKWFEDTFTDPIKVRKKIKEAYDSLNEWAAKRLRQLRIDEGAEAVEAQEAYTEDEDPTFNTGGPVIKRRGFGETATSPLAAGSFVDKPLYDRAVDTSPTYRRW